MRKLIDPKSVSVFLAGLAMPLVFMAQNPPAQNLPGGAQPSAPAAIAPARIAFVSIQQVIAICEEGKGENAILQQWAEKKRAELQSIQKELDTLRNQLDVQGTKLTEEARAELLDAIDTKDTLLQRSQQDTQKEAEKRQQRLTGSIYRKVLPVIEKMAKERNLDSVFFIDGNRDAYANPSLLVTDEVIKAYNAAYPAANAGQPIKKQ